MRSENNKIVEEGIKKIEEGKRGKTKQLTFFDYFDRFLSNRCVFDSFCFNIISCLILLLAIISRVFNQLILVKLLIVL